MIYKLPTAKLIFLLGFAGFLVVSILAARTVFAQDTTQATTENIGIQISAPVYNFGIDPGDSAQEIVKVRNVSTTSQTFYPEVFDFRPIGETGAPEFLINKNEDNYTYSLTSWISISKEAITLKPNESAALNFTINVPKDAEPGGRYAGILFGTVPPKIEGTAIAVSNKVGSLILVRVNGDAKESAFIKEFSANGSFFETPPVDFIARIENTGTIHVRPKGIITIKDTFGRKIDTLNVNDKDGAVLPESIRKFDKGNSDLTWNPGGFTIGKYTATLLLNYGDPSKQLTQTVSFWVIPWKILIVVGVGALILILLLILIIKRYNHWVVSKAQKKEQKPKDTSPASSASQSESDGPAPPTGPG